MKELKTPNLLLFATLFVLSCNSTQQHNKYVDEIPETSLKGKNIYLEGIYEPHRMLIVDSLLIITSFQGEYFFHLYNLTSHRLIKEFGKKGKGPYEFLSPRIFNGQRTIKENDSTQAPNMRYYISDIQTADTKIYVLLTIKLFPDLNNKTTSNIYVFDYNGNSINKFNLDREINIFCYDSINNRFIGHSVDELENPFIEYQLESK